MAQLTAADASAPHVPPADAYDLQAELESSGRGAVHRAIAPKRHLAGLSAGQVQARAAHARNRSELLREKLQDQWFAALLTLDAPEPLSIETRFGSWGELVEFVNAHQALVEVWAEPAGADPRQARRMTAHELASLRKEGAGQPACVTVTFRDPGSGQVKSRKVEFAFDAAARALTAQEAPRLPGMDSSQAGLAPAAIVAALDLAGAGAGTGLREAMSSPQLRQAIQEGGVIEQVVAARIGGPLPAGELEPQVHPGAKAIEERYTQVLSNLLEWQRYIKKKALGLPMNTNELLQAASVLEDLASQDIWIDDADALLAVDAVNGSFVYRRYVQGEARLVQVTGIPSRAGLVDRVAKAEAARRIEWQERAALAPEGHGLARIHRVREVNGRPEPGALVLSEDSAEGIDSLLALLDRLPVTDRARLRFDGFSRTMVQADFDGTGRDDRFFLSVELPVGKSLRRERINPLTGERERLVEEDGLLTQTLTDARIVEIDYNAEREETATRVYANAGSRQAPVKGALLQETRTLETWQRDLAEREVDPRLPVIAKTRFNHVTGETTREIYGLFPVPVATVSAECITYRQFNPYGILVSAAVFDNGKASQDFERPLPARLKEPVIGRERFQLIATLPPRELAQLRNLKGQRYLTTLLRRDLVKGLSQTETFDNGQLGRKVSESYTDRLDRTNAVTVNVSLEYRKDFHFGQIPFKTTQRSAAGGTVLSRTETQSYDPLSRRLVALEVDHTGKTVTNVWDPRWTSPVETHTAGRRTLFQHNQDETQVTGTTIAASSGEEISRFGGRFDGKTQQWQLQRVIWHRPGVTNRSQTLTLSSAGRVLSIRTGESLETRPVYGADGVEIAANRYIKHPKSGQFNLVQQREDDYRWNLGERNARIQRYVDGQPCDSFRRVSDVEGRTLLDQLRNTPGLALKTVLTYDGWTERPLKSETFQNDHVRSTRLWEAEERQSDGACFLPVKVVPHWGLTFTERFRAGDPLGRPVSCQYENQESLHVIQWYDGTAIPKLFERRDRHGRPKERFSRRLNAGLEGGMPCDIIEREKLSFWGGAALVETKTVLRGTDVPLYGSTVTEKVYYDLSQPFDAPAYAVDPRGQSGTQLLVRGQLKDYVLTVFRSRLENRPETPITGRAAESILAVDAIDLRQASATATVRRTFDRAGNLLDERRATLPALKEADKDDTLFAALTHAAATERFHYRYQPGWWVEQSAAGDAGRHWAFSSQRPGGGTASFAVNDGTYRETVTAIDGIKAADPAQASALKTYFFRRFHSPSHHESNPFLPGCSNLWSSWLASELTPSGETLFESELIYNAHGTLSVSRVTQPVRRGQPKSSAAYQLPEPDPRTWKPLRLAAGTNSFGLDLQGVTNLAGSDFLCLYLQNTNAASWSLLFKSASNQEVRVSPTAAGTMKKEIATSPLAPFGTLGYPERLAPEGGAVVAGPHTDAARDCVVLISVPDLARAGLEIARLSSATLEVAGKPGDLLNLSAVARLVREPRLQPGLDKGR